MKPVLTQSVWLIAAALAGLFIAVPSTMAAPVRVVLVTSSEAVADRLAVELATLQLQEHLGVEPLDRGDLQKALAEQQLVLEKGGPVAQAIAIGRILSVEVFAVLGPRVDDVQRLIAYDATTGVRLSDRLIPTGQPEAVVNRAVDTIVQAAGKRRRFVEQGLRLLSFHGYRNVDLSSDWTPWIDATRREVERRLLALDGVAVLERAELHYVNVERAIPTSAEQALLLASAANAKLEFSRADDRQHATVRIVLTGPGRKEPQAFATLVDRNRRGEGVRKLTKQLSDFLTREARRIGASQLLADDAKARQREAGRLRAEAHRLYARKEFRDCVQFREAVLALLPDSNRDRALLARVLDYHAASLIKPLSDFPNSKKGPSPAVIESAVLETMAALNYRLDLVEQIHARRKNENDWRLKLIGNNAGDMVDWHQALQELRRLNLELPAAAKRAVEGHCDRVYDFYFDEVTRYLQEQMQTPDEAARMIREVYHMGLGILKNVSSSPQRLFYRRLEQYDGWAAALRKRDWVGDQEEHAKAWQALMRLIDFHKYDRYGLSDAQIGELLHRLNKLAGGVVPKVAQQATRLSLAIRADRLPREAGTSIAERRKKIDQMVDAQAKPILAGLAGVLDSPREADLAPCNVSTMRLVDFDVRLTKPTSKLCLLCAIHSDLDARRVANRRLFERCMALDVFSPHLFYNGLEPNRYSGDKLQLDGIPERVAYREEVLKRLRSGEGKRSTPDLERVIKVIEKDLAKDLVLLGRLNGQDVPQERAPWRRPTLVAGQEGFPERRGRSGWPLVVGAVSRGDHLYYLMRSRGAAPKSRWSVSAYRVNFATPHRSERFGSLSGLAGYSALTTEQQEHYDAISSANHEGKSSQVSVDDQNLYWNRFAWGVLVFPLDGSPPFSLDEDWGLPSNYVHTVTPANGKLYLWVGRPKKENILVEVSLDKRSVRVLVSSERAVAKNALEKRRPRAVRMVHHDAARNRLLFSIDKTIWAWSLDEHAPTKVMDVPWEPTPWLWNVFPMPHRNELLVNRGSILGFLNLADDTYREVTLPGADQYGYGQPTSMIGSLVLMWGWSAYNLDSHRQQELPMPSPGLDPPEFHWHPRCVVIDDGKRCLIKDQYHLWLAEIKQEENQ